MEALYHFIRENTEELYVTVFRSRFFFIDYWSFVHFWSGVFLIAVALRLGLGRRQRWIVTMGILVGYEVLELAFAYLAIGIFLPETLPDQVTDLVVGALGGLAAEAVAALRVPRVVPEAAEIVLAGGGVER